MPQPNPFDTSHRVLLTPRQAAAMLNVSERKLWSLGDSGRIPRVLIDRSVRFDIADVQKFIADQKTTGTSK